MEQPKQENSLLQSYLRLFSPNSQAHLANMNVQHTYVRLFPLLLGCSRTAACQHFCKSSNSQRRRYSAQPELEKNPYYQKYAARIRQLELSNPKEFEKRMKALNERFTEKKEESSTGDSATSPNSLKPQENFQQKSDHVTYKKKSLDSIMKIEMVKNLTAEEIGSLWVKRYADRDAVSAVIPKDSFQVLQTTSKMFPIFVYPVPRKDGYELFVGQFANNDYHFTSLINYQKFQENAPSQLTINHFTELAEEKGIVLMSGVVTDDHLTVTDAQLLSYLVQYFCTEQVSLMRDFNLAPQEFDVNRIVAAVDSGLLARAGFTSQDKTSKS